MGCLIEPSPDGNYIIMVVTGDLTGKLAMENNIKCHALGRELGINRYLVDLTASRNVDSLPANFSFAHFDLKESPDLDPNARVAILVSPGDNSHDFIETVSKNRGLDVTLFKDRHQALQHLLADS